MSDITHAARLAVLQFDADEGLTMLIGPAADGALLEVGVLGLEDPSPVIIHAMPARAKYLRFLQ